MLKSKSVKGGATVANDSAISAQAISSINASAMSVETQVETAETVETLVETQVETHSGTVETQSEVLEGVLETALVPLKEPSVPKFSRLVIKGRRGTYGKGYQTFSSDERNEWKARRDAARERSHENFLMRKSVEEATGEWIPYDLSDFLGDDRIVVIRISREWESNGTSFRRDNWPKLKIVSKPLSTEGMDDPKSDDRYGTFMISAGSSLFRLVESMDVPDGGSKVCYSSVTGVKAFDPRDVRLSNASRVTDSADPETGELVRTVRLYPSYARLTTDSRISGTEFSERIARWVREY